MISSYSFIFFFDLLVKVLGGLCSCASGQDDLRCLDCGDDDVNARVRILRDGRNYIRDYSLFDGVVIGWSQRVF